LLLRRSPHLGDSYPVTLCFQSPQLHVLFLLFDYRSLPCRCLFVDFLFLFFKTHLIFILLSLFSWGPSPSSSFSKCMLRASSFFRRTMIPPSDFLCRSLYVHSFSFLGFLSIRQTTFWNSFRGLLCGWDLPLLSLCESFPPHPPFLLNPP